MFGLGITEIIIIVVILLVIFFGGKKLAGLAKSAGRIGGEFKKGKLEVDQEIKDMQSQNRMNESDNGSNVN